MCDSHWPVELDLEELIELDLEEFFQNLIWRSSSTYGQKAMRSDTEPGITRVELADVVMALRWEEFLQNLIWRSSS